MALWTFRMSTSCAEHSVHRGSATLEGGGQEVGMDGRHGPAIGQGDVVELLREPGRDPCIEAHELIRGVVAGARSRPASARSRELDPVADVLHPLLQPASTLVERLVSPSIPEAGWISGATGQLP